MDFRWYVMETDGNRAVRAASIKSGPYYDEMDWFSVDGYQSREEAKSAIDEYCEENGNYVQFYILEGN